jgi:hypothetical protein
MNSIKSSRAHSHVNWLREETDVSGTISVPIIRVVMWAEIVPETSVSSFNQLTRLCAREDFIEFSRRESFKLYSDELLNNLGWVIGVRFLTGNYIWAQPSIQVQLGWGFKVVLNDFNS